MKTQKHESFVDFSPYQGVRQYYDEKGTQWRQDLDACVVRFYRDTGNIFVHEGILKVGRNRSLKYLHNAFLREDEY